jgi:polysaccharide biosynthesis/export protein
MTLLPLFCLQMKTRLTCVHFLAVLLAIGLPLAGAAADRAAKPSPAVSEPVGSPVSSKADYILQPGDIIRVQVYNEEDINKQGEVRVSQNYTITLPLLQSVDLKGKTVRQAEELIRSRYDKDFLVNPQVTVAVIKYVDRFVQVFGSVTHPGQIPFPPEEGLLLSEAISKADGFTRLADQKRVTVTRPSDDGKGDPEKFTINVADLLKGSGADMPLQPNDIINVPERIL